MIKLDYIREYVALAETLNFSKAAELSFITQPALSRHIAILEEETGAKLFHRTTRSVQLTPAGEVMRDAFQKMLRIYQDAKEEAAYLSAGKTGSLKISSPYYWTEEFTEPAAARFLRDNPDCGIYLLSCQPKEGLQDMIEGKSDVFISVWLTEIGNSIRRVPFSKERLGVVLAAGMPLADRRSLQLEELSGYPVILLGRDVQDLGGYNSFILELLSKRGIHPAAIHYTQQIDTLGLTVNDTGGIAIMPYGVRHMDRSYLRTIPLEDEDCILDMCIYYRMDNENPLIPRYVQAAKSVSADI